MTFPEHVLGQFLACRVFAAFENVELPTPSLPTESGSGNTLGYHRGLNYYKKSFQNYFVAAFNFAIIAKPFSFGQKKISQKYIGNIHHKIVVSGNYNQFGHDGILYRLWPENLYLGNSARADCTWVSVGATLEASKTSFRHEKGTQTQTFWSGCFPFG